MTTHGVKPHHAGMQSVRLEKMLSEGTDETWGQKMRRYRNEAGLTMEDAALLVNDVTRTSHMSIARLEDREEAPTNPRTRATAAVALVCYGIQPGTMELSFDDIPAAIPPTELAKMLKRAQGHSARRRKQNGPIPKNRWMQGCDDAALAGVA